MKRLAYWGLLLLLIGTLATPAFAQQQVKWYSVKEYEDFMSVFNEKDLAKKAVNAEEFFKSHKNADPIALGWVYQMLLFSYAKGGNWAKAIDTVERMDQLAPKLTNEQKLQYKQIVDLGADNPKLIALDPNGFAGPPSAGPGGRGGIGPGVGTGAGPGRGAGVGPREGDYVTGGAFAIGGGVSEPVPLQMVQPEYSDDGRKARIEGTVELLIIVNPDGTVKFESVKKSLGYGLDQKAIEAVKKWKFSPGKKDGKPVPTRVSVLVSFALPRR